MCRTRLTPMLWGVTLTLMGCDTTAPDPTGSPAPTAAAGTTAGQVFYTEAYLDSLGGIAYDVNNKGQVVGVRFHRPAGSRPILWENGKARNLGTLGGTHAAAYAINEAGQVIGESSIAGETEIHAFLWENGVMHDLGKLGAAADFDHATVAAAINRRGQTVGWSFTSTMALRPVLWQDGAIRRLTGLETSAGRAYGIDSLGRVVGHTGQPDTPHAFRWQDGTLERLGTLGGTYSAALATNDAGAVVGWALNRAGQRHAIRWQNGNKADLGTLGGTSSQALAISRNGQIVGSSTLSDFSTHAFTWKAGVMTDVAPGIARGVNDAGWIVGSRPNHLISGDGTNLPVLWRPTTTPPEPPPAGTVTVGSSFFTSNHNLSTNPAVDTIPMGGTVTWTWVSNQVSHNVESTGALSFPSSPLMSARGSTYKVTFTAPGEYPYTCRVHGTIMRGRVVVQ
jgi:probable HAF family extracellular repeat protein